MRIGVPKETKTLEGRIALVPAACGDLVNAGHEVFIEQGAGLKSGFADADFERVGVKIAANAAALYEAGELIVKVKEPIAGDLELLRKHHLLFCYLHLAPLPELTQRLVDIGLTGVAFESVEDGHGGLPLLAPMSIIAGRIAVQVGTHLLHQPEGGKGKLLGGLPSAERGKVVVLGAGAAGGNSAALAAAMGANVVVFDKRPDRLEQMMALGANVTAFDPAIRLDIEGIPVVSDPLDTVKGAEVLVVLTEWDEFKWVDLDDVAAAMAVRKIVDTRNLLDRSRARQAGFDYEGIGRR